MLTRTKPVSQEIADVAVPTLVRAITARVATAERWTRRATRTRDAHRAASLRYSARTKLREAHDLERALRRLGVDVRRAEGRLRGRIARLDDELVLKRPPTT